MSEPVLLAEVNVHLEHEPLGDDRRRLRPLPGSAVETAARGLMTSVVRARIVVSGRVQGVWFRDSCRREAERLGLSGWVRNRLDEAVEIEAEGTPAALATLEEWARQGPRLARVDRLERTALEPEGSQRFEIR